MPGIESVSLSSEGWSLQESGPYERVWVNELGDALVIHYEEGAPDLGGAWSRLDRIRDAVRASLEEAGALVEVEADELDSLPVLRYILKFPQEPHGMTYLGSWTIPRRDFCLRIRVICREHEPTGVRDTIVWSLSGGAGEDESSTEELDPFRGWSGDPYDPKHVAPILRNRSDDEEWDTQFPQHPLSRVRATLREIKASFRGSEDLRTSEPYPES